ncbi:MAG: protein kinase [bacterium]
MMLNAGAKLGRYEIRSKIGKGGMGEVYLAHDGKLDRKVALKILPADVAANQDRMRRFVQEAKAAAALNHPNIAHIYEIGESDGVNYIAMEYIYGVPLNERIAGSSLSVQEILRLGIQLGEALDEAHSKGVTHRDIKPANIMITPRGQAKLLDFGLAKFRQSIEDETSREAITQLKTTDGLILGTVMYMSPEQALGQPVDHRSDIFSVGALFYELTTGRCPFTGSTNTEIIDRIVHSQPEAISRFNYEVPAELERIIRKCLEKDKARRYQSARELLVDFENCKRDSTTDSQIAKTSVATRSSGSRRWTIGAIGLTIAALTVLGIYLWRRTAPVATEAIDSIAVLPLVNSSGDANMEYLSDGITEDLINSLSQIPKLRVIPRVSVFRYKTSDIDPQTVARDLNVRAVLMGKLVKVGDVLSVQIDLVDVAQNRQLWGGKVERKLSDIIALQAEIATEISEKLRLQLSAGEKQQLRKHFTQSAEAYLLYLNGRYQWKKYTKDEILKSIDYFNQAIEKDPKYALAYSGLADAYVLLGLMFLPPTQVMPKAKAAADTALKLDENLAAAHISMGAYLLFYEWNWAAAQREAGRAKELDGAYAKAIELNTNYDDDHHFYCTALDTLGKPSESIAEMRRALELDPNSTSMNMEMGWSFYISRDYDQAIAQCRKAMEMDANFALAYLCTAQAYEQQRKFDQAIADASKARALMGDDPIAMEELGYAYALAGQKEDARKLAHALQEKSNNEYIDPVLIALMHTALGERDDAFKWLDKGFRARSPWMTWLKVEPKFDPLRSDPRFIVLMQRVGIA